MGLLTDYIAASSQSMRPVTASLELTNRCNERCTHCYLPAFVDDGSRVLDVEQWRKVLRELRRGGVLYLNLLGGEPLLNPLIWDIAVAGRELGFHLSLITNGLLVQARSAARLREVGFVNVTVSLYSLDPEVHDGMTRVRGSHARSLRAIAALRAANLAVGVNCLLTAANIDGFFALADWCLERGIEPKPDPVVTPRLDGGREPLALRASEAQLRRFYAELRTRWPRGAPQPVAVDASTHVCNAAKGKCAVNAYGDLLPCIEIRTPLGNLVRQTFDEAWSSPAARPWRDLLQGQLANRNPGVQHAFCEHCPGMAAHETGDPLSVSTFAAMHARVRRDFSAENP